MESRRGKSSVRSRNGRKTKIGRSVRQEIDQKWRKSVPAHAR